MKILIFGGDGMLGHQLLKHFSTKHEVKVTLRQSPESYKNLSLFSLENTFYNINVTQWESVQKVIESVQPDAMINAVGVVKQRELAKASIPSLEINSLFPHRLSQIASTINSKVIHLSTDCVFSGKKGMYTENSFPDCKDLYGRSKLLGELSESHTLTLRTSIIGLELARNTSLIAWFLRQKGSIKGFKRAIYSGFTTQEMARIIDFMLTEKPTLSGLWHVASKPISKYDLLQKFLGYLGDRELRIEADESFFCDRSLDGSAFVRETGYLVPSWDNMLQELAKNFHQQTSD